MLRRMTARHVSDFVSCGVGVQYLVPVLVCVCAACHDWAW